MWRTAAALVFLVVQVVADEVSKPHHHHHNHEHHEHHHGHHNSHHPAHHHEGHHHSEHHHHANATNSSVAVHTAEPQHVTPKAVSTPAVAMTAHAKTSATTEDKIMSKMRKLEQELAQKSRKVRSMVETGHIEVNGPLPADFTERFAQAVAAATGCSPADVTVLSTSPLKGGSDEIVFNAPREVVDSIEDQSADPNSKFAMGPMRSFLLDRGDSVQANTAPGTHAAAAQQAEIAAPQLTTERAEMSANNEQPVRSNGIDIDTEMPYGELEPFGREDTAQELTESSINESNEMVDQLERAEVAEEKRAVFRALTRLRGAAITSFDGVARSQTGNIDEYNKVHKWRNTHPLHHLADEESDIAKWAFPDNADF